MPVAPGYRWTDKWITANCERCDQPMTFRRSKPKRFCSVKCGNFGKGHLVADPSKQETHPCPTCQKPVTSYLVEPHIYCSISCAVTQRKPAAIRPEAECKQCGIAFIVLPDRTGQFCSGSCFGKWNSINKRGVNHPAFGKPGKPHPGPRVDITCEICKKVWQETPLHAVGRRTCSRACAGAWQSIHNSGPNNPLWKGGPQSYYGPTWIAARRAIRLRDKVCQRCGNKGKKALDVHHKIPFRSFGLARHEEANQLDNLVSLCGSCHLVIEWETNRMNPEYARWSDHEPVTNETLAALKRSGNHNPVMRGTDNPRAARTDDEIREIRRAYAAGEATQVQLAAKYHTSQPNIGSIVNGFTWRHVV